MLANYVFPNFIDCFEVGVDRIPFELFKCIFFNLSNALAGYSVVLPDGFKCFFRSYVDGESILNNVLFLL